MMNPLVLIVLERDKMFRYSCPACGKAMIKKTTKNNTVFFQCESCEKSANMYKEKGRPEDAPTYKYGEEYMQRLYSSGRYCMKCGSILRWGNDESSCYDCYGKGNLRRKI